MLAFAQAHIIEIGIIVVVLTYAVPYLGKLKGAVSKVIPAKGHMGGSECVGKILEVESALQDHGAEATADKLAYLLPEVVKACRKKDA